MNRQAIIDFWTGLLKITFTFEQLNNLALLFAEIKINLKESS